MLIYSIRVLYSMLCKKKIVIFAILARSSCESYFKILEHNIAAFLREGYLNTLTTLVVFNFTAKSVLLV